jgi:cytoplasmic iron level regulating protein YaaA (DUF328/UPF0246 family)
MYNAIDYLWMNDNWKKFFEEYFLIFSWMYWKLKPLDKIGNYKLPIESKWLYDFWWDKLIEKIIIQKPDYIVNLLPISYSKLLWLWKWNKQQQKLEKLTSAWIKVANINFLKPDWKKISHWVKKIKWEWIKDICERGAFDIKDFWGEIVNNWDIVDVNILWRV